MIGQGAAGGTYRRRGPLLVGALLIVLACPKLAAANSLYAVNAVRQQLCAPDPQRRPLVEVQALDTAAEYLARGTSLRDALARVAYQSREASALSLGSATSDQGLIAALSSRYCNQIGRRDTTEIGVAQRNGALWLVVAAPLRLPEAAEGDEVSLHVLKLVNQARGIARSCGSHRFPAAPPVSLSEDLAQAALLHSVEMARSGYFEHVDNEGRSPADRVRDTPYRARLVGENIAAGVDSAEEAVRGWLDSPGHCENLMDARFTHLGAGYATNPKRRPAVYWTLDLAQAR